MRLIVTLLLVTVPMALVNGQDRSVKQPFAIVISAEEQTLKAGSTVSIKVRLTNTSSQPLDASGSFSDLTGLDSNFLFDVRDNQGHLAPKRIYRHSELAGGHAILDRIVRPGETLTENQDISRLYDMTKPGKYVIQISREIPKEMGGGVVRSNTVAVTVTP
jgi:hypothetical protein